jgi:predicted component of type VI protein secretion system
MITAERKMKISELIEQLKAYPADSEVYLWIDGERVPAHSIDDSFVDEHWFIDINGLKE